MKIDNSIKKMEEALEKKKALRAEKSVGRVKTLNERVKAKKEKIAKLTKEVEAMEAEVLELSPAETKEEEFVPGAEATDAKDTTKAAGDQAGKSTSKITPKKK